MVDSLSPVELEKSLRAGEPGLFLLDVREDDERETARIEPSVHIPMQQVPTRLAEIPRGSRIVVYCHHGGRSEMIAGFLETRGYAKVANLEGGIDAWAKTVDPTVPRY